MKSSPFKLFSLSAREADQRGNYANPELGRYKATTFDHPDLSGIKNSKPKAEKEDSNTSSYKIPIKELKPNFPETPDMPNLMGNNNNNNNGRGSRNASGSTTTTTGGKSYRQAYAEAGKPGETYKQYVERADQWHKDNPGNRPSSSTTTSSWNTTEDFNLSTGRSTAMNMKGSPVKHNTGAVGSIGNADPLAGGIAGIGQQISNQAQQRAAKLYTSRASNGPTAEAAGGMIGVTGSIGQDVLPPPNQVAETGSYGGGGDRILEMDSNPVGNQSIGRDTDVASQLFGSGQRASMLAMKGTPLHTEGHGGAKGHTHAKPGDDLDQTVAENMGVNDIENYKPIQGFKGGQIVVNSQNKDTIFSKTYPKRHGSTFVIPEQMDNITRSSEGTPEYKPVYINRNKKQ